MSIPEGVILKIAQNILLPDEQTAVNVFWAELFDDAGSGPLDESDILDAASNWMDDIYANLEDDISNECSSTVVEVWTVDEATGDLTSVGDEATTWAPTNVNDPVPNGVAGVMSMKSTNPDVTGRKFIPGLTKNEINDNHWDGGRLTALTLFAVDWATQFIDLNDVGFNPGVYSTANNLFYLASGTTIINGVCGYQRRRKPGVGT